MRIRRMAAARMPRSTVAWLNPAVAFPLLWIAGVLLAQIDLTSVERGWSAFAFVVVATVPIVFVLGARFGRFLAGEIVDRLRDVEPGSVWADDESFARRRVRRVLLACIVIGYAEMAHQFIGVGAIPLFSANIDAVRIAQPGGPTVVLTDLLTIATIAALLLPKRLAARAAIPELMIVALATAGFLAAGGRGPAVTGIAVGIFARIFVWGPPPKRVLFACAVLAFIAIEAAFFVRTSQHQTAPFEAEIYSSVLPQTPLVLQWYIPLHVGLTYNFDVLVRLVDVIPSEHAFGYGAYSLAGFDLVVPGTRSLEDLAATITSPFVTSTAAGPYWSDFGLPGIVVGMGLFGALSVLCYDVARRRPTFITAAIGGYAVFICLFGVYANLYTSHPDWPIVAFGLVGVGWLAGERWQIPWLSRHARTVHDVLRRQGSITATMFGRITKRHAVAVASAVIVIVGVATGVQVARDSTVTKPEPVVTRLDGLRAQRLPLPLQATIVAADSDSPVDNTSVVVIPRRGGADIRAVSEANPGDKAGDVRTTKVRFPAVARSGGIDVATWNGNRAIFGFRVVRDGIDVQVRARALTSRPLASGHAPTARPLQTSRILAIATWSGPLPDLFVITRGTLTERARLEIYSGESRFATRIMSAVLPLLNTSRERWALDVGRGIGDKPSIVGVKRSGAAGAPEVHVLSGDSGYQQFSLHQTMDARPFTTRETDIAGLRRGRPSVMMIDPASNTEQTFVYSPTAVIR